METTAAIPFSTAPDRRRLLPLFGLGAVIVALAVANLMGGAKAAVGLLVAAGMIVGMAARPELAVGILLASFLVTTPTWLQGRGALTLNNILGLWLLVAAAYRFYMTREVPPLRTPEVQLLAAIGVVFFAAAYLHTPDRFMMDLIEQLVVRDQDRSSVFIGRFAFLVFLVTFVRKPRHVRMIFLIAVAAMILTPVAAIQKTLAGGGFAGYRARSGLLIAAAGNPNRMALFSVIGIVAIWYMLQHRRRLAYVLAPMIPAVVLAVFMTGSRSGVSGMLLAFVMLFFGGGFSTRKLAVAVLAGALAAAMVVRVTPERSLERITSLPGTEAASGGEGEGSLARREYAASLAVELFKRNPTFGVGIGNWEIQRYLADPVHNIVPPHSSVLLAMVEGGTAALVLYLALIGYTLRTFFRCVAATRHASDWRADFAWIASTLRTGFIVFLAFSLVADIWANIVFYWFVGLSACMRRLLFPETKSDWAEVPA